jgi:hypothetical protein
MDFDLFYFFLAIVIGFLYVYVTFPTPKVVIKHPTPNNVGETTYVDNKGICYRYRKEEIKCTGDKKIEV